MKFTIIAGFSTVKAIVSDNWIAALKFPVQYDNVPIFCLGSKILCLGYVKEFWLTEAGSAFFRGKNHILQEFVYKQNRIYLQNRMYFEALIFIRTHTKKEEVEIWRSEVLLL